MTSDNSRESVFIVTPSQGRRSLRTAVSGLGYAIKEFQSASLLLHDFPREASPLAIICEVQPRNDGSFNALQELAASLAPAPVIALSSDDEPETVVRAVRLGAAGFLRRPVTGAGLRKAIASTRYSGRETKPPATAPAAPTKYHLRSFVCASPKMRRIEETVRRVADSDVTVLIRGESGSGKEVVARYIHLCSNRQSAPFVKVNCAALPENLLESELFGYERGAFTGAAGMKPGKFEAANHGTIFLDEITETSPRLQAKLLHVLQDKQFNRLGGNRDIRVDARVLAATNKHLETEVDEGRFREDLYFRLKVVDVLVPPLRERREEIPLLINHFRQLYARQYRRPAPILSERLLNVMAHYRWSGNVRELENIIKRIVILDDEPAIVQELLSKGDYAGGVSRPSVVAEKFPPIQETSLKTVSARAAIAAERALILKTLETTRWNRVRASRILGVSYKTLLTKMKKCGLSES